jgi:SAM-dependent methyltransferase
VSVVDEQKRYYRERAAEYDDWWFRRGRYDEGAEENARWFADAAEVEAALDRFAAHGDVLELACGTGLWTRHLARTAQRLVAVDAAPEVLALNRERVGNADVEYVEADLFEWDPPQHTFDSCVFGFWLSHVPEERFDAFWSRVRIALRPDARVFFVDSGLQRETHGELQVRTLADGREFTIVKRYFEPGELTQRLARLGWDAELQLSANRSFLYGTVRS